MFGFLKLLVTPRRSAGAIAHSANAKSGVLKSPLSGEGIWKRERRDEREELGFDEAEREAEVLGFDEAEREAEVLGFDEAEREAEVYDHLGFLNLGKMDCLANYEEATDSAEKRERASHLSDLADAKKREDGLKNVVMTLMFVHLLHEARKMEDDATKMLTEAEDKMRRAEEEGLVLQDKVKCTESERLRLREEIDTVSAQKQQLEAEADRLKAENAKCEAERKLICEKREELLNEATDFVEKMSIISEILQEERDSLREDEEVMRHQYERARESLSRDRESLMKELEQERFELFELRLKEEIATNCALGAEADRLKAEKFEAERKLICEKREELLKEAADFDENMSTISEILQKERDRLREYEEVMRDQYERARESLSRERESLMKELEQESFELFELRLKEDIVTICALGAEADRLKAENAKFEAERKIIGEKGEELLKEAAAFAERRSLFSEMLQKERDRLRVDEEVMRDQYERAHESLSRDRESLMKELEQERKEWFGEIQKESTDFWLTNGTQKMELDNCIEKERLDSIAVLEMQHSSLPSKSQKLSSKRFANRQKGKVLVRNGNTTNGSGRKRSDNSSSPISAPLSGIKRRADTLLEPRQNSEKRRKEDDDMGHESVDAMFGAELLEDILD